MNLSSDYVKVRIRKGATYAAVLSVKATAASQPASQPVSQSLREFLDWDGILMFSTGHSLNENRTRKFNALVQYRFNVQLHGMMY
jgi:hypothetical protein